MEHEPRVNPTLRHPAAARGTHPPVELEVHVRLTYTTTKHTLCEYSIRIEHEKRITGFLEGFFPREEVSTSLSYSLLINIQ